MKALKKVHRLSEESGFPVTVKIGLHYGGPVIAGALSLSRPSFLVLGEAYELANHVSFTCPPNCIVLTRSVFENIFELGYNVTDRGMSTLRNKASVQTFLISS